MLPKVADFVQAWSMRGQNQTVKSKGREIESEVSPEEMQKVLDKLERGRKKR